jgi:hypothetical protein
MKLIQILVLVTAMATAAMAQNTSSASQNGGSSAPVNGTANQKQKTGPTSAASKTSPSVKGSPKGGSSAQASGVKLIVPKAGTQTGTAGAKNSSSTNAASTKGASASTTPSKAGAQPLAGKTSTTNKSGVKVSSSGQAGTKSGSTQKTPVLAVKPVQKPATKAKSAKLTVTPKNPASKAVTAKKKKDEVKIVPQKIAGDKKPASETNAISANGRRDPFLSIIRNMPVTAAGPNCSVGKRCLFIPELELKGIAKDPDGQMLAVVVSNTHRAYFLRENDQVFNGSVQRITSDSVVFREFATDHLGRETAHEVVKKIPKS